MNISALFFIGATVAAIGIEANAQAPATTTIECLASGSNFAACAMAFERVRQNGDRLTMPGESYSVGWFEEFVMGVAMTEFRRSFCPALPFDGNQVSAVVAQYVRLHPEKWGERPDELTIGALSTAFICRRKTGN